MLQHQNYVHGARPPAGEVRERQAFSNPQSAWGGGVQARPIRHGGGQHYIHMLTLAAPLIIGELVQDSQKRWRWIRICSLVGAVASEAAYQHGKSQQQR